MANQFDCNNVLTGMDGYANKDDASGPTMGTDALQLNCTTSDVQGMQKIYKEKHWQLKGPGITAGKNYKVDLHFYGVVECKTYVGGTGPAKTDPNETPNVNQTHNLWLAGSTDNGDHWNTYAFTVTPASLSKLVGIGPQTAPADAHTGLEQAECDGRGSHGREPFESGDDQRSQRLQQRRQPSRIADRNANDPASKEQGDKRHRRGDCPHDRVESADRYSEHRRAPPATRQPRRAGNGASSTSPAPEM
jgi:hypothetical protein